MTKSNASLRLRECEQGRRWTALRRKPLGSLQDAVGRPAGDLRSAKRSALWASRLLFADDSGGPPRVKVGHGAVRADDARSRGCRACVQPPSPSACSRRAWRLARSRPSRPRLFSPGRRPFRRLGPGSSLCGLGRKAVPAASPARIAFCSGPTRLGCGLGSRCDRPSGRRCTLSLCRLRPWPNPRRPHSRPHRRPRDAAGAHRSREAFPSGRAGGLRFELTRCPPTRMSRCPEATRGRQGRCSIDVVSLRPALSGAGKRSAGALHSDHRPDAEVRRVPGRPQASDCRWLGEVASVRTSPKSFTSA